MSEVVLENLLAQLEGSWRVQLEAFLKEKDDLSLNTKINYGKAFLALNKHIQMDLRVVDKQDLVEAFHAMSGEYESGSVNLYKTCVKRFYKWLLGRDEEYPLVVKWMKIKKTKVNHKQMREGLITEGEVVAMVKAGHHPRDKAFVATLYESAARIGEMLSLRMKDVKMDQYGAVLMVSGKTGIRPIRVVNSTPYLQAWMNFHPRKEEPDALVWINLKHPEKAIGRTFAFAMLKRLARKAGVKKNIHPHAFRHSRLTQLAKMLKEPEMRIFSGWTEESRAPSVYVHLSGRDVDQRILEVSGVKLAEEEMPKPSPLKPRLCPRCDYQNPADAKYCSRCSMVLDLKAALELDEERKRIDEVMELALKDPEVQRLLMDKMRQLITKSS